MDVMMPLVALVAMLMFFWVGSAGRAFPMATNFEGRTVPVAGMALALGILAALQWHQTVGIHLPQYQWTGSIEAVRIAILAFGTLGYVDDRWGDRSVSGFRGHIGAALHGRFTTGFLKLAGGGLAALLCGRLLRNDGWEAVSAFWLLKSAVIALSANAVNLLDTRPARAVTAFIAAATASLLYQSAPEPSILSGIGAAIGWLPLDRRRMAMLGDAGSNVLGAVWGVTFVAYAHWEAVVAALAVLVAFHLYAERRSLNADIAAMPLLRRLDKVVSG